MRELTGIEALVDNLMMQILHLQQQLAELEQEPSESADRPGKD